MDTNRMKKAAEWFYSTVFHEEAIRPRATTPAEKLPSLLRTARSLEDRPGNRWQSRESVFLKQARLLAAYEDDYAFSGDVGQYYPTYQSLTDSQLRGYFSWRTQLRKGNVRKAPLTFAFLYIYELLNQVGVQTAAEGYARLTAFRDAYAPLDKGILSYLTQWLTDYVVYFGLDPNLLGDSPQVLFDRSITVLEHIRQQSPEKVLYAVRQLAPSWLSRSRFYAQYPADCDTVIVRVLQKVSDHYAGHTKRTMVEQLFGRQVVRTGSLFASAVFCDPLKIRSCEYALDEQCIYRCTDGIWTVTRYPVLPRSGGKLEDLLKTIDAVMREEYAYRHLIRYETETKWLIRLIREQAQALLAEKKAAEAKKITIDYSQLAKIRHEAAITQDRLTVEEDREEIREEAPLQAPPFEPEPAWEAGNSDTPLLPQEYRLLQCLLYSGSLDWIRQSGCILSVLTDGINDKLYDTFQDSVVDDTPALVEDYIEDLKEMVAP